MKLSTGNGLYVHVMADAISSISNYRLSNSENPMKGMSEVRMKNGDGFLVDGHAETLFAIASQEKKEGFK